MAAGPAQARAEKYDMGVSYFSARLRPHFFTKPPEDEAKGYPRRRRGRCDHHKRWGGRHEQLPHTALAAAAERNSDGLRGGTPRA